jgi:hypothetical protein
VLVCVDCDRTLLTRYPVSVIMVVFRLGGRLYRRGEWVLEGEYHGAIFPFYKDGDLGTGQIVSNLVMTRDCLGLFVPIDSDVLDMVQRVLSEVPTILCLNKVEASGSRRI